MKNEERVLGEKDLAPPHKSTAERKHEAEEAIRIGFLKSTPFYRRKCVNTPFFEDYMEREKHHGYIKFENYVAPGEYNPKIIKKYLFA